MQAYEKRDYKRIEILKNLTNAATFWDDVRKHTKNLTSDHALNRWLCLAEQRYDEIKERD
jgi:hypothetical protein